MTELEIMQGKCADALTAAREALDKIKSEPDKSRVSRRLDRVEERIGWYVEEVHAYFEGNGKYADDLAYTLSLEIRAIRDLFRHIGEDASLSLDGPIGDIERAVSGF